MSTAAVSFALPALAQANATPTQGPLKIAIQGNTLTWQDQPSEVSYHVSGTVHYGVYCGPVEADLLAAPFDQALKPDTTTFTLPRPKQDLPDIKKATQFTIEALDIDNNVVMRDQFNTITDPECGDPERSLADGPREKLNVPLVATALLATIGITGLTASLLLKRRSR